MATRRELIEVSPEKLEKLAGFTKVVKHSALFPKRATAGPVATLQRRTLAAAAAAIPAGPQPAAAPIRAVRLTAGELAKLRAVHESSAASAEMIAQKLGPDQALASAYSALVALRVHEAQGGAQGETGQGQESEAGRGAMAEDRRCCQPGVRGRRPARAHRGRP